MAGGRKRPNAVSAVRIYDPDFMETKPVKLPVKLITKQMDFKSSDHSAGVKSKSSKSLPLQAPPAATQLDQSSDDQLSSPKSGPWTPPQIMKRIVKRSSIEALKSISDVRKREEGKRPAKVRRGNFQSIAVASPPSKTAARKTKLHLADDIPLPTKYAETLTSGSKKLASVLASSEPLAKSILLCGSGDEDEGDSDLPEFSFTQNRTPIKEQALAQHPVVSSTNEDDIMERIEQLESRRTLSQPTQQTKQEQQQPAQSQPVPSQLTEKQSQPNCEDRKENGGRQKPTTVQSARIAEIHVGEAVLVLDTRGDDCYHPALVIERPKVIKSPVGKKKKKKIKTAKQPPSSPGPSNLYSIQFWTGKQSNVNRSKICSKNDSDFFGVKVTEKFLASNPGIVELTDAQLKQEFLQFLPDMERLNEGQISDCERYADFKAGGRRRRLLTQRMGHGGFSESQTEQLFSELNGRFAAATAVCSVNESIIIDSPAKKKQRSNDDDEINSNNSNDDEDDDDEEVKTTRFDDGGMHTLDFNSSVLLPELMIRILMKHRRCNRQQAEDILLNGDRQTGWASQLLAFRQMFQR